MKALEYFKQRRAELIKEYDLVGRTPEDEGRIQELDRVIRWLDITPQDAPEPVNAPKVVPTKVTKAVEKIKAAAKKKKKGRK